MLPEERLGRAVRLCGPLGCCRCWVTPSGRPSQGRGPGARGPREDWGGTALWIAGGCSWNEWGRLDRGRGLLGDVTSELTSEEGGNMIRGSDWALGRSSASWLGVGLGEPRARGVCTGRGHLGVGLLTRGVRRPREGGQVGAARWEQTSRVWRKERTACLEKRRFRRQSSPPPLAAGVCKCDPLGQEEGQAGGWRRQTERSGCLPAGRAGQGSTATSAPWSPGLPPQRQLLAPGPGPRARQLHALALLVLRPWACRSRALGVRWRPSPQGLASSGGRRQEAGAHPRLTRAPRGPVLRADVLAPHPPPVQEPGRERARSNVQGPAWPVGVPVQSHSW